MYKIIYYLIFSLSIDFQTVISVVFNNKLLVQHFVEFLSNSCFNLLFQ